MALKSKPVDNRPLPGDQPTNDKTPSRLARNAAPVDQVADEGAMHVEGEVDWEKTPSQQLHYSIRPPALTPETAWQEYIIQAIQGLYPHMRDGVDFAVGRRTAEDEVEILDWNTQYFSEPDMDKIRAAAEKLSMQNPYSNYEPGTPLHAWEDQGADVGERHKGQSYPDPQSISGNAMPAADYGAVNHEIPPDLAQSSYNPTHTDKVPSQGEPGPAYDDARTAAQQAEAARR